MQWKVERIVPNALVWELATSSALGTTRSTSKQDLIEENRWLAESLRRAQRSRPTTNYRAPIFPLACIRGFCLTVER